MASCVTICAFAPETRRSYQMLLCMQSMLPHLLLYMEEESNNSTTSNLTKNGGIGGNNNRPNSGGIINNSYSVIKHELAAYATLGVEMRALANSCDVLARGPTRSLDFLSTNNNGGITSNAFSSNVRECKSRSFLASNERADSPQFFDPPTIIDDETSKQQQPPNTGQSHSSGGGGGIINNNNNIGKSKLTIAGWADSGITTDIEIHKEQFRGPRDALLTLCAIFIHRGTIRLKELSKLLALNTGQSSEHSLRIPELLDHRCHSKISEVAVALLKLAPYDAQTLTCNGLRDYFSYVLPIVDWTVETNRSSINVILRRLDKTIVKIAKRQSMRRIAANWEAVSCWLTGLHKTLLHSPHLAHLHSLKTITLLCLRLTLGDTLGPIEELFTGPQQPHISTPAYSHTVLNAHIPPSNFSSVALKLFTIWAESQRLGHFGAQAFSLELICTPEAIGPLAERPEALFCQFLIPMFLRAAIPGKESPKFQSKDLHFCLNLLQLAICPPLVSKQSVVPMAVSGSSLATSLMRESTGGGREGGICVNAVSGGGGYRQGSVSVTEKGGFSATVSTARIVRDSVALAVILAIKAIVLSFQKQLTVTHWLRISRIVREMIAKKCGGSSLINFIEFIICSNLPISEMLQPLMQIRLNQRPANDLDASWQSEMRERLFTFKQLKGEEFSFNLTQNINKQFSTSFNIFNQLQVLRKELILLREDFVNRKIPRSHTPTIGGEIHSDSGSSGTGTRESRRLSSSAALGKLRWIQTSRSAGGDEKNAKKCLPNQQQENNTTIVEMEETTGDEGIDNTSAPTTSVQHKVNKSPSLPFSVRSSMLRVSGIRRKAPPTRLPSADSSTTTSTGLTKITNKVEMREVSHELGRRTKSLRSPGGRFAVSIGEESSSPVTGRNDLTEFSTPSQGSMAHVSTGERPRVVSFSTPRHSSISETISEADSETEFCITSIKHLI